MTSIALYTDADGNRPLRYPCDSRPPETLVVRGVVRYLRMVTTFEPQSEHSTPKENR